MSRSETSKTAERILIQDRAGSAAVEFALIAPVMILLMLGIVVCGIYIGAYHNLRQLAAEAARASIGGVSDQERGDLARRRVESALTGGAMFKPGSIRVTVEAGGADPALYTVTLSFESNRLGLSGFAGLVPLPPDLMTSTVSIRRGGA